jgi:hypothetical protein
MAMSVMLLYFIIVPPLFAAGLTIPWWARAAFRVWLGLVNPDWDNHVHGRPHTPTPEGAISLVPPDGKRVRHLRLVRGGRGDGPDRVT